MLRVWALLGCLLGSLASSPVGLPSLRLERRTMELRPHPRLLLSTIRGGNWDEDDEDDDDDDNVDGVGKDRYRDMPPPDEIRYTHGMRTGKSAREGAIIQNMTDKSSADSSDDDEPAWVDGQIKQGGKKIKYYYGRTNYWRDVLNQTDPWEQFEPDLHKGQTYADFMFAKERFDNVDVMEQHGPLKDRMRDLIAEGRTTPAGYGLGGVVSANFSFSYPENRFATIYPNLTGNLSEIPIYDYDSEKDEYFLGTTIVHNDDLSVSLSNKSRLLEPDEVFARFVPYQNASYPEPTKSRDRYIKAFEDQLRWENGELPMPLNEEDLEEIEEDKRRQINEQLCEAAEQGSVGLFKSLMQCGGNVSWHMPPDMLAPLHYAALNGHLEIVKILIEKGVNVSARDDWDRTPLHWAAYNGHVEVAKELIANGANVMAKTKGDCTPYVRLCGFLWG
uniref:Uncharacterized protein n=1 Tax=Guillardia theta TaxID=55529 RepID=A0A7S4KT79_GUITH|mmetsp:Transcript_30136/g.96947  ORF Transcript_30136/g.96947 Transcript_30136/m.96947 type:complete len:446 (+) Transcript_30136:235-1572(+)